MRPGAVEEFQRVANLLRIPVTTAWTHDLIPTADELFCGRPGTIGERAGNFTVQNSDTLLVLGSRLNIRQVSYNWKAFARHAFRIQVDIDAAELSKPTVGPDLPIHCDLKVFLTELARQLEESGYAPAHREWLDWSKALRAKYPVVLPKHRRPRAPRQSLSFCRTLVRRSGVRRCSGFRRCHRVHRHLSDSPDSSGASACFQTPARLPWGMTCPPPSERPWRATASA